MNSRQPKRPEYSSIKVFSRTLSANKAAEVLSEKGEFLWRTFVASLASCSRNRFFGVSPFQLVHLRSADTQMVLLRKTFACPVPVYFSGKYINLTLALLRLLGEDCFFISINNVRKTFPNFFSLSFRLIVCFLWVTSLVVKPAIL